MAKDSVELIRGAEQTAQQTIADARKEAARVVREAQLECQRRHDETMAAAKTAALDTIETAKEGGRKRADKEKDTYTEKGEHLKRQAAARREQAVAAVIKSIVEG